jgi:O-acetylserine/cysteine efflux transporter
MPVRDWLAALLVVSAWGINFVVIKFGLTEVPPLLLGALRFIFVAFPAVLFVPRPKAPWRTVVLYGLTISFGQFAFLFTALYVGMPAGLASLVLQSQAFFTVLIAAYIMKEPVYRHNVAGMLIAIAGLYLVSLGAQHGSMPMLGFIFTLAAALSWASGNIVVKGVGKIDMFSLVVWGAVVPPLPFLAMSLVFEGPERMMHSLLSLSWVGISAIAYLAMGATVVGYVLWGRLLSRHPASKVAPLTLLVPVLGLVSASVVLNEHMSTLQWVGAAVILVSLLVNSFGARLFRYRSAASRHLG